MADVSANETPGAAGSRRWDNQPDASVYAPLGSYSRLRGFRESFIRIESETLLTMRSKRQPGNPSERIRLVSARRLAESSTGSASSEVGDRPVRYRLDRRADDAADARRCSASSSTAQSSTGSPPGWSAASDGRWMSDALQLILANPEYRGLIPRNDTPSFEGLHERLVDHELFERAQQILRRRADDASLRRGNPSDFPRVRRHR